MNRIDAILKLVKDHHTEHFQAFNQLNNTLAIKNKSLSERYMQLVGTLYDGLLTGYWPQVVGRGLGGKPK